MVVFCKVNERRLLKLSMMKFLMRHIEKAATIVNIPHLLVNFLTPLKSIGLYNEVNNLFLFPDLNKNRRYKTIVWRNHQRNPLKIKYFLVRE